MNTVKYRIKMVQKYNGENLFIPQYRDELWWNLLILKIIISPIVFLFWLCFEGNKKFVDIINYFSAWKCFSKEFLYYYICNNKLEAELIINNDKKKREEDIKRKQADDYIEKINKIKKVIYIEID